MASAKDTVYIDIDDDITAIIDKLQSSAGKVVALVLPKRTPSLQISVNLKLLKRASESAKKNVVLVTNESALLPIAGLVGLHVAKTLQSKPSVPQKPGTEAAIERIAEDASAPVAATVGAAAQTAAGATETAASPAKLDLKKSVGEYVSLAAFKKSDQVEAAPEVDDDTDAAVQSLDDDIEREMLEEPDSSPETPSVPVEKLERRFKIPNFERFRLRFFLGIVLVIALVVGLFVALKVLPKAVIVVKAEQSTRQVTLQMTGDTSATTATETTVPAKLQENIQKLEEGITPTGTKDLSARAKGTVTLTNCSDDGSSVTIPYGTGISVGDKTYITQVTVTLPHSYKSGGKCVSIADSYQAGIAIVANAVGDQYNQDDATAVVAGYTMVQASGLKTSGGTTKVITIVSSQDVEKAKERLLAKIQTDTKAQLKSELEKAEMDALEDTYQETRGDVKSTPAVGEEATTARVSLEVKTTMYGISKEAVEEALRAEVAKEVDIKNQEIVDTGFAKASVSVDTRDPKKVALSIKTIATIGAKLVTEDLKKQIAGKKLGDTRDTIRAYAGVRDVVIEYSPFWVFSTPKNTEKIDLSIETTKVEN